MYYFRSQGTAIVGVEELTRAASLIQRAEPLAKQLDLGVRALHACQPWTGGMWVHSFPGVGNAYEMQAIYEKATIEVAELALRDQLKLCEGQQPHSSEVVVGNPARTLVDAAERSQAALIICEARHESYRLRPRGMSTLIGVLAESKLPVLILPHQGKGEFKKQKWRIALCDDLRNSTLHAIAAASELATAGKGHMLQHIHCSELNPGDFESFSRTLTTTGLERKEFSQSLPTFQELLAMTEKRVIQQLKERCAPFANQIQERNCEYQPVVLFGEPHDELAKFLRDAPVDLLVFGRHQMFHDSLFLPGNLSLSAMVSFHIPVLIVP